MYQQQNYVNKNMLTACERINICNAMCFCTQVSENVRICKSDVMLKATLFVSNYAIQNKYLLQDYTKRTAHSN